MVKKAAIPLADAVRMASETPAKLIGIDSSKGTLQKGKDADIPHHRQGHQHQVRLLLRQDRGRNEHPGTLKRFRRRAPGAGGVFSALMQKRKPCGTCDAAGLLLRRRLPTLPLAQYHRRDEA